MPFLQWVTGEPESDLLCSPEFGKYGLVAYYSGTCPLLISVPHGGEMRPPFIQDREKPSQSITDKEQKDPDEDTVNRITMAADIYTQEIAQVMVKEYCQITGLQPYLVMCNLHRSKLDPNRPLSTAAQDPVSQMSYSEYHDFLCEAKKEIRRGLLIDLHGQNHQQNSIELGYLYKKFELNAGDFSSTVPSVATLLSRSSHTPEELVTGDKSLGAILESYGYRAVPSPRQPCPGNERYYRGGYITQTHGSQEGGPVDAIQIEVPAEIRHQGGQALREAFSLDLARVLADYMDIHYNNSD